MNAKAPESPSIIQQRIDTLMEQYNDSDNAEKETLCIEIAHLNNLEGHLEEAKSFYLTALDSEPQQLEALFGLGEVHHQLGELESSLGYYKQLSELFSSDCTYNNMGNIFRELNQLEKAKDCFETSVKLNSFFAVGYSNLGLTLKDLDNLDGAIVCLNLAVTLDPTLFPALNNLGICYTLQGNQEQAKACFQKALEVHPESQEVINNLSKLKSA